MPQETRELDHNQERSPTQSPRIERLGAGFERSSDVEEWVTIVVAFLVDKRRRSEQTAIEPLINIVFGIKQRKGVLCAYDAIVEGSL